ncbi:hypothetical protein UCRNP2_8793 [Neofusicoccum parvum UCRNP2]|uniref:Uncharacterized protein n=1 Tax=Botryosphaeria parva (strain UCR-NP2) TaxID=1287680 RepID=R1GF17_BOTPV|nr:hypothetical protein UCRNP2_8793 [Neofusicoccum parvum UCRNP2]
MLVPGVSVKSPAEGSFLQDSEQLKNTKKEDIVGEELTYKYEITTFMTNAKEINSEKDYQAWGTLGLGVKHPHGVLQHVGSYRRPSRLGPDKKRIAGNECDISDSIELVVDASLPSTSMHYVKHADHITEFSFDIIVTDFGTDQAAFTGTMTTIQGTYDWYGEFSDRKEVTKKFEKVVTQAPPNLVGSIAELVGITPVAWKAKGSVKAGEDAAQKYGDELMNKIMMHALDPETRKTLLPNLPALDATAQSILDENRSFFRRGAIHLLADQFKEMKEVDEKLKKCITTKFKQFMDMLTAPAVASEDGSPAKDSSIAAYGWDPVNDAQKVSDLRLQYQRVTMRCYQEGYKVQCPEWGRYLKEPEYWFNEYSQFLVSREHVGPWRGSVVQRANQPGTISVDQELLQWGNKLSMLKNAAPKDRWDTLDVDRVTGVLAGEAQMALVYAQKVDDELLAAAKLLFEQLDTTDSSAEYKEMLSKRSTYSEEIDRGVREEGVALLSRLVNHDSNLAIEATFYWENRLPPGAAVGKGGRMTVGQIITSWEDDARLRDLRAADNLPPLEEGPRKPLWDRIKGGAGAVLGVIKTALHVVAFSTLISQLASEGSKMHPVELTRTICALASETINAIGWASRKALNWLWNKGFVFRNAIGWFNDALKTGLNTIGKRIANALVGSIGKVIRLIGLAGCICSIISSYWDMQKAESMNKNDRTAFLWYSRVSFALGCLEGLVIVTGMVAEVFGWVSCATVCGPVGIAIGVIMIVATVVYYVFFAPDPLGDIKKFLRGEAKDVGSYKED